MEGLKGDSMPDASDNRGPGNLQTTPQSVREAAHAPVVRRTLEEPAARSLSERTAAGSRATHLERSPGEITPVRQVSARERQAKIDQSQAVQDALFGYPVESAQLADVLENFSRLCMAGWMPPEALRHAGRDSRPALRRLIEEAAVRAASGMSLADALTSCSSNLPPLLAPALRAWERNGQRDADLRILTREMRRLGELQQRNTFFQIQSFMERAAKRERQSMGLPTSRNRLPSPAERSEGIQREGRGVRANSQRRINASRGGIANRSRATMRWTDLFVSLWRCNVPISEALEAAGEGCGNNYYCHVLTRAAERTREGVPLSECLAETRLLSAGLIDRLRTGEASGRMDETLEEFARIMEGDAKELGGQHLFMRRILPVILIVSAMVIFAYCTSLAGNPGICLIGALIFLPVAFAAWELVFKQTVAGEPKLGIGKREPKGWTGREQR